MIYLFSSRFFSLQSRTKFFNEGRLEREIAFRTMSMTVSSRFFMILTFLLFSDPWP